MKKRDRSCKLHALRGRTRRGRPEEAPPGDFCPSNNLLPLSLAQTSMKSALAQDRVDLWLTITTPLIPHRSAS